MAVRRSVEECLSKLREMYDSPLTPRKTERSNSNHKHERSQKRLERSVKFEEALTDKSANLSNLLRLSPDRALSRIRLSSFYQDELKIDSTVTNDTETLRAIFYPEKLTAMKLLFRASRHKFRVAKFHEECD